MFLTLRRASHKKPSSVSAIKEHCEKYKHAFDNFSFDMIYREPENNKRQIAETFLIQELDPDLNKNDGLDLWVFANRGNFSKKSIFAK